MLKNFKEFFHKYESYLSSGTLVLGFVFDFLTLNRVDLFWDNFFIVLYLFIAGTSIILINLFEEGRLRGGLVGKIYEFLPFVMQFSFGGLFSAYVIFYSKSTSFLASSIFIAILLFLLIGNEFFKKRYQKIVFQMGVYFIAIFSFSIFFLPVLTKEMGDEVFMLSGLMSLISIGMFTLILSLFSPNVYKENRNYLLITFSTLYILINILYFTNIIPPIPLSMKSGGVYHSVLKISESKYQAIREVDTGWFRKLTKDVSHFNNLESAYVFSSVFAPTDLNTRIVHNWQYYDANQSKWISTNKVPFSIVGGRENGYRVFSKKENIFPGEWRVDVTTEMDQVIGRVNFRVVESEPPFGLETINL